jgi:hypothetical protein
MRIAFRRSRRRPQHQVHEMHEVVCLRVCRIGTGRRSYRPAPASTRLAMPTLPHDGGCARLKVPLSSLVSHTGDLNKRSTSPTRTVLRRLVSRNASKHDMKKRCSTSALRPHSYIIHRNSYIIAPPNISRNESSSEYRISGFYRPLFDRHDRRAVRREFMQRACQAPTTRYQH